MLFEHLDCGVDVFEHLDGLVDIDRDLAYTANVYITQ